MNSQFESIRKNLDHILQHGLLFDHLYGSIDGVAQIMAAIYQTRGVNWTSRLVDSQGNPRLTPEEQQRFTDTFEPYIESIVTFFGKTKGGAEPTEAKQDSAPEYDLPDMSSVASIRNNALEESGSPEKMTGIDNLYAKVIHRLGSINSVVNHYASQHGILQMEKKSDVEPDIRLIPQALAQFISNGLMAITGIPSPTSMEVMNKIKVPFRLIVMVIYLGLDVARVSASVTGEDQQRKILSICVAILEFLRGDWKKAVLTFMGYYGTTPLLMGHMMKIFLTLFQVLSPTLQDSIIYGALDTTKSFIIGVLLAILKLTAPEEVRKPMIELLEKIAKKKAEIDGTLTDANLSARADYFAPTFDDFNNIQALMDDPEFICSTEFEQLIEQVNKTAIINIILQILRIPVTKEFREYRCGKKPSKPFLTLIADKAKEDKEKHEMFDKPFSIENTQMPVAVPTTDQPGEPASEESAVEPAAEPVVEPSVEPVVELAAEPSVEPAAEPSVEPAAEPSVEPADEPVTQEIKEEPVETPAEVKEPSVPLPPVIKPVGGTRNNTHKVRGYKRKTLRTPRK